MEMYTVNCQTNESKRTMFQKLFLRPPSNFETGLYNQGSLCMKVNLTIGTVVDIMERPCYIGNIE